MAVYRKLRLHRLQLGKLSYFLVVLGYLCVQCVPFFLYFNLSFLTLVNPLFLALVEEHFAKEDSALIFHVRKFVCKLRHFWPCISIHHAGFLCSMNQQEYLHIYQSFVHSHEADYQKSNPRKHHHLKTWSFLLQFVDGCSVLDFCFLGWLVKPIEGLVDFGLVDI